MAVSKIHKLSKWTLYSMLAITVVVLGMFFLGGYVDPTAEMLEPIYTDVLIYWMYVLVIVGVAVTLGFAIFQFALKLKDDTKSALQSLAVMGVFALMMVICWSIGSGEPLYIQGYEGTENVYFWLKFTDMLLYAIYALIAIPVLIMLFGSVMKFFKK